MILYNAGKPRPAGGELQSDYKNRLQDMPGIHMKASPQVLPDGKVTAILDPFSREGGLIWILG